MRIEGLQGHRRDVRRGGLRYDLTALTLASLPSMPRRDTSRSARAELTSLSSGDCGETEIQRELRILGLRRREQPGEILGCRRLDGRSHRSRRARMDRRVLGDHVPPHRLPKRCSQDAVHLQHAGGAEMLPKGGIKLVEVCRPQPIDLLLPYPRHDPIAQVDRYAEAVAGEMSGARCSSSRSATSARSLPPLRRTSLTACATSPARTFSTSRFVPRAVRVR